MPPLSSFRHDRERMQAYGATFSEVPANHLNTNGARGDYKDAVAEYTAGKRGARLLLDAYK